MKCPKCGSKYITVVNRPIQLEEKTKSNTMTIMITIAILALIFGLICLIAAPTKSASVGISSSNTTQMVKYAAISPPYQSGSSYSKSFFNSTAAYTVGSVLVQWSAITLLACGIINALRPHKVDNKLIGVCMDCGHSANLKEFKEKPEEKTEATSEEENQQG